MSVGEGLIERREAVKRQCKDLQNTDRTLYAYEMVK